MLPTGVCTGIGSLPGDDIDAALALAIDSCPDLAYLPELPARGAGSDLIGRTLAATELDFDLQPAGWRLVPNSGFDAARAREQLARDLDALMPFADFDGVMKLQLAGPWTLASTVELPRGGKALRDRGAVRDIVEALANAIAAHLEAARLRLPQAKIVVQIDEPALSFVIEGRVPTESGWSRLAAIPEGEVTAAIASVVDAVKAADSAAIIHCCATNPPLLMLADSGVDAISWDASKIMQGERYDEDAIGQLVERGVHLWLGAVPSLGPGIPPTPRSVADPIRRMWHGLGFAPADLPANVVVTPTCGLAGASSGWARESMRVLRQVAKVLSEAPELMRS